MTVSRPLPLMGRLLAILLVSVLPLLAWAQQDAGVPVPAADGGAGLVADSTEEPQPSPEVAALQDTTRAIRALMKGDLDVAVVAATLFDGALDDERAVAVEVRRLKAIVDNENGPVDAGAPDAAGDAAHQGGAGGSVELQPTDPLFAARLALDTARLAFLILPKTDRDTLLATHAQRREAATKEAMQLAEQELKRKNADEASKRALEDARRARSLAQRRVLEEVAALNQRLAMLSARHGGLLDEKKALDERPNVRLDWESKVSTLITEVEEQGQVVDADALYDSLVKALDASRSELDHALDRYASDKSAIAPLGSNPLIDLGDAIDTSPADQLRVEVTKDEVEVRHLERLIVAKRTGVLVQEVASLNRGRLELLPYLSDAKSAPLYGFGSVGIAQARTELDMVMSVLRYHLTASTRWVQEVDLDSYERPQRIAFYWGAFKILAALLVFIWWFGCAIGVLVDWGERVRERNEQSRLANILRFAQRVRRPAEWLILFWTVRTLLPTGAASLLEVELIEVVLLWTLGEALVVDSIDALFARRRRFRTKGDEERAKLRLRSLRLVGRVVVVLGLSLSLGAMLVGEGTIYNWVAAACWYVASPVAGLLVHWWKPHVFQRISRRGKHSALTGWVHQRQDSWMSFVAAALGAGYLIVRATSRFARGYASGFDLSRRVLAYRFRQELSNKDNNVEPSTSRPLSTEQHRALDPESPTDTLVPSVADPQLERVIECINAPGGGVFAIVGERGSGKTTMLRRIANSCKARMIQCPFGGVHAFSETVSRALDLSEDSGLSTIRDAIIAAGSDSAMLIDDTHHLVRPVIGGLDDFDRILALARESSIGTCTWVFALDSVIWQYFERARGAKPLFDDVVLLAPWSEDGIARLLKRRSKAAGIDAQFDRLLKDLPEEADDIDRFEAFTRAETNYYRLLWDYADGNPGVALHFWRESLAVDDDEQAWVRLFEPPDITGIESLPDEAIFVLRAVVQLELASIDDIIAATMLPAGRIRDALRYAVSRGWIAKVDTRYRVRWAWFRAISNVLQNRHLLVGRS